jgi:hypothetical protein
MTVFVQKLNKLVRDSTCPLAASESISIRLLDGFGGLPFTFAHASHGVNLQTEDETEVSLQPDIHLAGI